MSATIPPLEDDDGEELSYDECFDLLSSYRRRYTLHYLEQNSEEASISDLSEQVAAWENEKSMQEVSYNERKRVYTSLQQVHLPRMDEVGVVEFDENQGTVETGPAAEKLDIYLDVMTDRDVPWSVLYVGIAVTAFLVVSLARPAGLLDPARTAWPELRLVGLVNLPVLLDFRPRVPAAGTVQFPA